MLSLSHVPDINRRHSRCSIDGNFRRRQSRCSMEAELPYSGHDVKLDSFWEGALLSEGVNERNLEEFYCGGINEFLGADELSQIFHVVLHTDWLSTLTVCKSWCNIATRCYKERILPVLSHSWIGWSKWTTRFMKPIDWDVQAIRTDMKFSPDKTLSGEGKNHGFASTWVVGGSYDLTSNSVCWYKEFIDGQWKGRTIKYEGKLVFEAGSVSIEGVTVLMKKEVPENPWDKIGDTGAFKLTSLRSPNEYLQCK